MSDPKVSIVIPMFNVEKYIGSCLNSILIQTLEDFELIIVDDCSTDRSSEIVRSYKDSRIKLVRNVENLGEGMSRNFGLSLARGKYIYFMDSDDAILENTLEMFYTAAEESGADVVYMNSRFRPKDPDFVVPGVIAIAKYPIGNPTPRFVSKDLETRINQEFFGFGVDAPPWFKIQRRDFLLNHKILFPTTLRSSDLLFNLAELCISDKIRVIDFCGYIHRPVPTSVMHSSTESHLRNGIRSLPIAVNYVEKIFQNMPPPPENLLMEFKLKSSISTTIHSFSTLIEAA